MPKKIADAKLSAPLV